MKESCIILSFQIWHNASNQENIIWSLKQYLIVEEMLNDNNNLRKMENYNTSLTIDSQNFSISNAGACSFQENLCYAIFIDIHKKSMTSKKKMRQMQFYQKLSLFIGTRTTSQCRSHHQKVFAKLKYISKITEIFKTQLGIVNYKNFLQQGIESMQRIDQYLAKRDSSVLPNSSQLQSGPEVPFQPLRQAIQSNQRPQESNLTPSLPYLGQNVEERLNGAFIWLNFGEAVVPYILRSYPM